MFYPEKLRLRAVWGWGWGCPWAHGKVLTGPSRGPCPRVSTALQDEGKLLPRGQCERAVPAQPFPDLAPELRGD